MKKWIKILFVISQIVCILSCSDTQKTEYEKSYETEFRKSFRTSFIESCAKAVGGNDSEIVCTCIADDLLENLTVVELKDENIVNKYFEEVSSEKCLDLFNG